MVYEYLYCICVDDRVQWANNQWAGEGDPLTAKDPEKLIDTCPRVFDFLNQRGQQGWELVAATNVLSGGEVVTRFFRENELRMTGFQAIYLKRVLNSSPAS